MRRLPRVVALLVILAATPSMHVAYAADDADARALDLFEKSEAAYDHGRFAEAIQLLRQSYAIKQEPVLLYNMGRAYEGLGDLGAAAKAYEDFLQADPKTPDRGALERRIATLRRQLLEREELKRQAEKPSSPQHAKTTSAAPWVVAGVGAAGLLAGGAFLLLAHGKHDEAKAEPTYRQADKLQSQAETLAIVGNVSLIAGGAILLIGTVWGVVGLSASRRSDSALAFPTSFTF